MLEKIQQLLKKDPFLLQEARGVALARYWYELSGNGEVIWGTYRSKRSKCQSVVDLRYDKIAFHCNCRSRKNPCKHGMGLILLMLEANDSFTVVQEVPEEVQTWLKRRDQRLLPKAYTEEQLAELAKKRQQTREKRLQQMAQGLDELEIWLHDSVRAGLASLYKQPGSYWTTWSTKMIDAKMKGIAARFDRMPILLKEENWNELLLETMGDIYLIIRGFRNLEGLAAGLQDELFSIIGVNVKKEEVLQEKGIADEWCVLAIEEGEENRLLFQRVWLYGKNSQRFGLHLDFAWGTEPFKIEWQVGSVLAGEWVYYPASYPQRGLFRFFQKSNTDFAVTGIGSFQVLQQHFTAAISKNPWLFQLAFFLETVVPFISAEHLYLVDLHQQQIPCEMAEASKKWQLLALSGGHPIDVFGIWRNHTFLPLAAQKEKRWVDLSVRYERKTSEYDYWR
ncbi:MAG: hypothetical protein AAF847_09260 [Bacteroidota bacterium]